MSLEARHHRVIAGGDLSVWEENGIANVTLIGHDNLSALQRDRFAVEPFQRRGAHDRTSHMAAAAAQFPESPLSRLDEGAARTPLSQPGLVLSRIHHNHSAHHAGMLRPTIFSAE